MIFSYLLKEVKMILVSITTNDNFYKVDLNHRLVQVSIVKKIEMHKSFYLRTLSIFVSHLKGVVIILKRLALSRIRKTVL